MMNTRSINKSVEQIYTFLYHRNEFHRAKTISKSETNKQVKLYLKNFYTEAMEAPALAEHLHRIHRMRSLLGCVMKPFKAQSTFMLKVKLAGAEFITNYRKKNLIKRDAELTALKNQYDAKLNELYPDSGSLRKKILNRIKFNGFCNP